MPMKYYMSTDSYVELKDTKNLQKASLDIFARWLGYEYNEFKGHYVLDCDDPRKIISLQTIQDWHNYNFVTLVDSYSWHGEYIVDEVTHKLGVADFMVIGAMKNKLVTTTHLQYSKKKRKIIVVDHQVQFV